MTLAPVAMFLLLCVTMVTDAAVIDLTHVLGPQSYHHGVDPAYNHTSVQYGQLPGTEVFVNHGFLIVPEHAGTHIDAPAHFIKGGATLDQLDMTDLVADGVMIDMTDKARNDRDYRVTVQDLQAWEAQHGQIPDRAAVVFNFGWSEKFTDIDYFTGSTDHVNYNSFRFPGISQTAGQWLVTDRDIKIVAVDTLSPDPVGVFHIHTTYLPHRRLILENVKIPASLPVRDFRLYVAPYRFLHSTGAPSRVFAVTHDVMRDAASGVTSYVVATVACCLLCLLLGQDQD